MLNPPLSLNGKVRLDKYNPPLSEHKVFWHFDTSGLFLSPKLQGEDWPAAYFDDPQVIALCKAIRKRDIDLMERLIKAGADVNAVGKRGVTPLYCAYCIRTDPRPFGLLLHYDADPNVVMEETLDDWPGSVPYRRTVAELCTIQFYNRHYGNVYRCGGDPNRVTENNIFYERFPLSLAHAAIPDCVERAKLLIRCGAKVDLRFGRSTSRNVLGRTTYGKDGITTAALLATYPVEENCEIIMLLLQAGANYKEEYEIDGRRRRLIELLAENQPKRDAKNAGDGKHFKALIQWLEERGQRLEEARDRRAREHESSK